MRLSRHITHRLLFAVTLFWLGNVLVDAVQLRLDPEFDPANAHWPHFFFKRTSLAVFWAWCTLVALHVYGERPPGPLRGRQLWVALGSSVAVSALYTAWLGLVLFVVSQRVISWSSGVAIAWPGDVIFGFFTICQIQFAAIAWHSYWRMLNEQRESERLQLKLRDTELMLFRAQLEPHFLFNALNSIASLVRLGRHEAAIDALAHLSHLLRGVLEVGQRQVMPWQWESEFARLYVTLQKLRFAEKLEVTFDASEVPPDAAVPILLLQPLLENAIVHGPLADGRRCEVGVTVRERERRLHVQISNDVARQPARQTHGLGLRNLDARLTALFGTDFRFTHAREGERFVVAVEFPIREVAA